MVTWQQWTAQRNSNVNRRILDDSLITKWFEIFSHVLFLCSGSINNLRLNKICLFVETTANIRQMCQEPRGFIFFLRWFGSKFPSVNRQGKCLNSCGCLCTHWNKGKDLKLPETTGTRKCQDGGRLRISRGSGEFLPSNFLVLFPFFYAFLQLLTLFLVPFDLVWKDGRVGKNVWLLLCLQRHFVRWMFSVVNCIELVSLFYV